VTKRVSPHTIRHPVCKAPLTVDVVFRIQDLPVPNSLVTLEPFVGRMSGVIGKTQ
jgi:hypothetical protein